MKSLCFLLFLGGLFLLSPIVVFAAQSSSSHLQVNEVQFGAGSQLNATSSTLKAQQSLGATAGGTINSATLGANAGFLTPNEPFLQMVVNNATLNLGTLSSGSTSTGTATFSVRAYVDSGYTVITTSDPPVNESGYFLKKISAAAASITGTEQFGMNLVNNLGTCFSSPVIGTNPVPIPNSSYAHGQAASGYNTCGKYQYNKNDVIAQSSTNGWGETDYTISYLVNISTVSPAGHYTMLEDLVAVTTY